jgi:hypothetical protein
MGIKAPEECGDLNLWFRVGGSRIITELILGFRFVLRSLGVDSDGVTLLLGDTMSVIFNTSFPSRVLNKKYNALADHCVRESIAAKMMRFARIKSKENASDILTKSLRNENFHSVEKKWLF